MRQQGLLPVVVTFSTLACGKDKITERALQLIDEMWQQDLQFDVITYNALISACAKLA